MLRVRGVVQHAMAVHKVETLRLQRMLIDVALEKVRVRVCLAQFGGLLDSDRVVEADELLAAWGDETREPSATAAGVEHYLTGEIFFPQIGDLVELELILVPKPVIRDPLMAEGIRI